MFLGEVNKTIFASKRVKTSNPGAVLVSPVTTSSRSPGSPAALLPSQPEAQHPPLFLSLLFSTQRAAMWGVQICRKEKIIFQYMFCILQAGLVHKFFCLNLLFNRKNKALDCSQKSFSGIGKKKSAFLQVKDGILKHGVFSL